MKILDWTILIISLAVILFGVKLSKDIYEIQSQVSIIKEDYAEINKVNYGLFNMEEWRVKAFDVFTGHIDQFNISPGAYKEAEGELRKYLYSIYDEYIASGKIFTKIFDDAEKNGKVNKVILKMLKENVANQIQALGIKENIPDMAKTLAKELKSNEPRFRQIMQDELKNLLKYDIKYKYIDPRQNVFAKYTCENIDCTNGKIKINLEELQKKITDCIKLLSILLASLLMILLIGYELFNFKVVISVLTLSSLILLALGISLPMINIDVRMNSFVFNLFEKDLVFPEQVVFYQSKSILDVTKTLLESSGIDLKIVGILILCFSVIFPVIKLVLSALYLFFEKIRTSRFATGMIFYLGKWSMADVFVVALFMAYIGFYGMFDAQMRALEQNKGGFAIETVNYTELSYGAMFFTAYCILSIIIGLMVNKIHLKQGHS